MTVDNFDNYFELNLSNTVYKIQLLSGTDMSALFKKEKVQGLDSGIYSKYPFKVYKLASGEVLIVKEGEDEFPLYPSEDVLLKQLSRHNASEAHEILKGVNVYGDRFPEEAEHIAASFLNEMGINYSKMNSTEIIEAVDSVVVANRNKSFFNQKYLALITVIGYVINKEYNTSWVMVKSNDVWNPKINFKGHNIFFADYISIDFDNMEISHPIMQSYLSVKDIINFNLRE